MLALAAVLIHSWAIVNLLHSLPGMILHQSAWDLAGIASYVLLAAATETLLLTGIILVLCIVLPEASLRDRFLPLGAALTISGAGGIMVAHYGSIGQGPFVETSRWAGGWGIALAMAIMALAYGSGRFRGLLAALATRCLPLAGIYALFDLGSALVVLLRNV